MWIWKALQTEYDSLQSSHEELAEQLVSVKEELKPMKEITLLGWESPHAGTRLRWRKAGTEALCHRADEVSEGTGETNAGAEISPAETNKIWNCNRHLLFSI